MIAAIYIIIFILFILIALIVKTHTTGGWTNPNTCRAELLNRNIYNRKDFLKWSLTNHPDKVPSDQRVSATNIFKDVNECVMSEYFPKQESLKQEPTKQAYQEADQRAEEQAAAYNAQRAREQAAANQKSNDQKSNDQKSNDQKSNEPEIKWNNDMVQKILDYGYDWTYDINDEIIYVVLPWENKMCEIVVEGAKNGEHVWWYINNYKIPSSYVSAELDSMMQKRIVDTVNEFKQRRH